MECLYDKKDLIALQNRPLGTQVNTAITRIIESINRTKGDIMICFSGGKDSALLLDMYCDVASRMYGINTVRVGYADTTNETAAMRSYVPFFIERCEKKYGVEINMTKTRPAKGVTFVDVVRSKGVPFVSKQTAHDIVQTKRSMDLTGAKYDDVIRYTTPEAASRDALKEMGLSDSAVLHLCGWRSRRKEFGKKFKIAKQWLPLLNCDVPITSDCCSILKERPLDSLKYINTMTGEQASESAAREAAWMKNGCNYELPQGGYKSKPFATLSQQAILYALASRDVPLSPDYGEITMCGDCYKCTKAQRTGCALCGFGIKFDTERFVRLQENDPAKVRWAFMDRQKGGGGYKELCEYANEYCGTKIVIPEV